MPWRDSAPTAEAGRTAHRFAPATEALVHKQALSAFNDSADSYRLPIKGGDGPVLSPARQQTLERSFNDVLPTFVAEHRKADEGARVPFAGELTAHIATALWHSGLDARCRCGGVDASVVKIHVRPASGITLRKTIAAAADGGALRSADESRYDSDHPLRNLQAGAMQHDSYAEARIRDATLAAAPYGMFICGADGSFECVNAAFEKLTGFAASELVGRRSFESLHDRAELAQRSAEWPALSSITTRYEGEWTYVRRNQSRVRVVLALAPIASSTPPDASTASTTHCGAIHDTARYVGIAIDMTRYTQSEARLWYVSHHDGVTRLPNQTLFTERLDLTIARCQRSGSGFTVLIAELDHLRKLRDALGLHAAELVLQIVGERLRGLFPNDGTIASIGGTQFALLINETGAAADAFAATALERIAEAIDYAGTALNITASIGIVAYPADGSDAPTLMRRAGVALSAASAVNGNAVRRFSTALEGLAARRFELETMLSEALERQQLHLVYQPQVTLATGRIAQVETLLRWNHPQRGLISPVEFVPVAEEAGLIERIGEWVIRTACRDAGRLLRLTGHLPRVAVNVSPQQFQRQDLFDTIRSALEEAALDPSYLEVEITEGMLLGDTELALQTLHSLRELGVEVAVDDFGTGYSSLAYLMRFPLNRLKIDRSFVMRMTSDPQSAALVGAIIAMAHALNLRVTAEGVETAAQAEQLRALGCDEAQGYWFSRPIGVAALRHVLQPLGGG